MKTINYYTHIITLATTLNQVLLLPYPVCVCVCVFFLFVKGKF